MNLKLYSLIFLGTMFSWSIAKSQSQVKDINSGISGSNPSELVKFNNKLFFRANNNSASANFELWSSDGTSAGTNLLYDVNSTGSGFPSEITVFDTYLLFSADNGTQGEELYKYTTGSTYSLVSDINTGAASSSPKFFTALNSTTVLFNATNAANGEELFKYNPSTNAVSLVKDINTTSGASSSFPEELTAFNGKVYFAADNGINGYELWVSDGTSAGTFLLKDINPSGSSYPTNLIVYNNKLYFTADNGANGTELWTSDGTNAGTVMVADLASGTNGSNPQNFTVAGAYLYFTADNGNNGTELYRSNGTLAGTNLIDVYVGVNSSSPNNLTAVGNVLFFSAEQAATGVELFKYNGSTLSLVKDIAAGATGSGPQNLKNVYGILYFSANNGTNGNELWKSDGTSAGTVLVQDIQTGAIGSFPTKLAVVNSTLYFVANDGTTGNELYSLTIPNTPALTQISNQITAEDIVINNLPFSINSVSGTANLTTTATSNNQTLLPNANLVINSISTTSKTLTITPALNKFGTGTVTVQTCDVTNNCVSRSFTVTVTSVNDAPFANNTTLAGSEDVTYQFDSTLLAPLYYDVEASRIDTFVILSLPNNATLLYQGTVVTNADLPLYLYKEDQEELQLDPDTNFNAISSMLFRATDGELWSDTAAFGVNFLAVNDAPIIISTFNKNAIEDITQSFNYSDFQNTTVYFDVDTDSIQSIIVTALPLHGVLFYNGDTLFNSNLPVTVTKANLPLLTYRNELHYFGGDTFSYKVNDGGLTSELANDVYMSVAPVNDVIVTKHLILGGPEDNTIAFTTTSFDTATTDVEGTLPTAIKVESLPSNGNLMLGSANVAINDVIARAQFNQLKFVPDSNWFGTENFVWKAYDDSALSNTVGAQVVLNVASVNDAPFAATINITKNEDVDHTFAKSTFSNVYTDLNNEGQQFSELQITRLATNGVTVYKNTPVSSVPFTISSDSIFMLKFMPDTNWHGSTYYRFKVSDGEHFSAIADSLILNYTSVNDAPLTYRVNSSTDEDNTLIFLKRDFTDNYTDVDNDTLQKIKVLTLPNNGTLKVTGIPVTITNYEISANSLSTVTFEPDTNWFGTSIFTYVAADQNGLYSIEADSVVMTINPINDAPLIGKILKTTNEDTATNLLESDFLTAYTDIENHPLTKVRIMSAPANGQLLLNNAPVNVNDELNVSVLNNFVFQPNLNFNGTTFFRYRAFDGINYSTKTDTFQINYVAVNDAPILGGPNFLTADEDVPLKISSITLTDVDALANNIQFHCEVTNGTLSLETTAGLSFSQGTGVNDTAFTFTGTLGNVLAAIDTITFLSDSNYNGFDQLTCIVNDLASTGIGGAKADTINTTIQVNSINDSALITLPATQTIFEDTDFLINGITITDVDNNNSRLKVTLKVNNGVLSLSNTTALIFEKGDGLNDAEMIFSGTFDWVNPALNNLKYHSNVGFVGSDQLFVSVVDTNNTSNYTILTDNDTLGLNVIPRAVSISTQPAQTAACVESPSQLSVVSGGTPPLAYQWFKNGVMVPGATASVLPFNSVQANDSAMYYCEITNPAGTVLTNSVKFNVNDKPVAAFSNTFACVGQQFSFVNTSTVNNATFTSFVWNTGDATSYNLSNPLHTYNVPNNYSVELIATTNKGCKDTLVQTLPVTPTPQVQFATANVCKGDTVDFTNNTSVTFGNLTYQWNFGDGSSDTITGPTKYYPNAGTYNVTLTATNNNLCSASQVQAVQVFNNPTTNFTRSNVCLGTPVDFTNTSTNVTFGASFVWNFGDGTTSNNVSPTKAYAVADTFTVQLKATTVNGCVDSTQKTVVIYPKPTAAFTYNNACDGLPVNFTNGSSIAYGSVAYNWSLGNNFDTTATQFSYTYPNTGNYAVKLKVTSGQGCADSVIKTVNVYPVAQINATSTNVACSSVPSGSISISTVGGTSPFSYSINGGTNYQGSNVFQGLGAGSYNIQTLDANGCISVGNSAYTITSPPQLISSIAQALNVDCYGGSNGSIAVTTTGGTAPYTYTMNGGALQTATSFSNLSAGYYNFVVTDGNNCTTTVDTTISQPSAPLNVTGTFSNILCHGAQSGTITIHGTGGTTPYLYSVSGSGNLQTDSLFINLGAASYTAYIQDANGCDTAIGITLNEPALPVTIDSVTTQNIACKGASTGTIEIFGSGGTGALSYTLNSGSASANSVYNNLQAGAYSILAEDVNGCTATQALLLTEPTTVFVIDSVVVSNVLCNGGTSGSAELVASGGDAPYSYAINNAMNADSLFAGLAAGTYTVSTTDLNNCTLTSTVTVSQPQAIISSIVNQTNTNCENASTGSVDLQVQGGTAPFTFTANGNNFTTNTITGLGMGNQTITITDANNCTSSIAAVIATDAYLPQAEFAYNVLENAIIFNNLSIDADTQEWFVNTQSFSTIFNPVYVFDSSGTYNFMLVAENQCGTDSLTQTVQHTATGISELNAAFNVALYPQPAQEHVIIETTANQFTFEITNAMGQVVLGGPQRSNQPISIQHLSAGIYWITIQNNAQSTTLPLMIEK